MTSYNYNEATPRSSISPGSARASRRGMSCREEFFIDVGGAGNASSIATVPSLQATLIEICGTTNIEAQVNGTLSRVPPVAHPKFPWLIATDITEMRGKGGFTKVLNQSAIEVPIINTNSSGPVGQNPVWIQYTVGVEFSQVGYALAKDSYIASLHPTVGQTWTTATGGTGYYGQTYEWLRYTEWNRISGSQYATATQGHMVFANDGTPAGGKQYAGMPRLPLPDATIKFKWYGVPLAFILNNNQVFDRYKLCVNQFPFYYSSPGRGDALWPAGSLLYVDYAYDSYTPPVPGQSPFLANFVSSAKLVDIEFTFAHTTRLPAGVPITPANTNFIASGWNLQPWWGDMNYHYVTVDGTNNGRPTFLSFPFELLFFDPRANLNP